jgi:hypothetical protein
LHVKRGFFALAEEAVVVMARQRPMSALGGEGDFPLERDDFSSNRHPALSFCLSMIFSENRCTLFRIML